MIVHTKPVRSERYKAMIRSLWCVVCGRSNPDACHTGPHAYGRKASDLTCIPLCRCHHREMDSNPVAFAERYGLDIPAIVAQLSMKPKVEIHGAVFVVVWANGDTWQLYSVSQGTKRLVQACGRVWRMRVQSMIEDRRIAA